MNDVLSKNDINTLLELTMVDLRKPEINPLLRARVVNNYLKTSNQTLSQASRFLGIPKTTLHTWLMYNKIGEDKYAELLRGGLSKTQVHNIVKNPSKLNEVSSLNPYEYELEQLLVKAKHLRFESRNVKLNARITQMIKDIINELNRALIVLDSKV